MQQKLNEECRDTQRRAARAKSIIALIGTLYLIFMVTGFYIALIADSAPYTLTFLILGLCGFAAWSWVDNKYSKCIKNDTGNNR